MKTLFICSANVWRSQIAEWYYNKFTNTTDWISSALIEDRREKYNFSPTKEVIDLMVDDEVDITAQKIKLLTRSFCEESQSIILLLNPIDKLSEFEIEWKNAVSFLLDNYSKKLKILPIQDPFWEWIEKVYLIRNQIKDIIKSLLN